MYIYNYEFAGWLESELKKRGWNQSDLARAAHKGRAVINKIISGVTQPSNETLIAIAAGLNVPAEVVFREAGFLNSKDITAEIYLSQETYLSKEAAYVFNLLPHDRREEVMRYMRFTLHEYEMEGKMQGKE